MSTRTVNINGIDLVYEKEGSGPAVVFIHGGNASAVWWEHVIPHFLDSFTCYALEQRGHGRSGRAADGRYDIGTLTGEATAFTESLPGPVVLVGQSQGGVVALGVAANRPQLVRGVYLEDSVPVIYGARGYQRSPVIGFFRELSLVAEESARLGRSLAAHTAAIGQVQPRGRPIIDVWPPDQLAFFARNAFGCDPAYYRQIVDGSFVLPHEVCDALPARVKCPVHLAYGDTNTGSVVLAEDIEQLQASGMNLTTTHFPGAGHGISRPFAREFIDDLKAFLGRVAT